MPPIDRREYLTYTGSAAIAPLVAATRTEGAAEPEGEDSEPRDAEEVHPSSNLQVESATNPLGVEAVPPANETSGEQEGAASQGTSGGQSDGRPGADWIDYEVEASFRIEDRAAGFVFRAQDPGNFYLWQIILDAEVPTADPVNAILRTHVVESGVAVIRENVPFQVADSDAQHTCRIAVNGQRITTHVDGEQVHTTVDTTYESGTIGFRTDQREHFLVDEVTVADPDGEELFAADFSYGDVRYFSGGTIVDNQLSLDGDGVVLRADRKADAPAPPQDDPPVRTEAPRPRLSWEFVPAIRGQSQAAYQVRVASSERRLLSDRIDKWDSGKVERSDGIHVEYDGEPLTSGERVYWKVRVWDEEGRVSEWSEIATWEMGLIDTQDWTGDWIAAPSRLDQARLADQWTDYTVETTFTIGEGGFGIPFRARDSYNCYLVEVVPRTDQESPRVRFKVREHGQWETLSDETLDQSLDPHTSHTLRVEISGNTYTTYLDDTQVNSTDDGRHTLGRFGFYIPDGISATVEELVAEDPNGTVLHSDDFSDPEATIDYAAGEMTDGELRLEGIGLAFLHRFHPFVTPSPLLRRDVTFEKPVREAHAYVSGLGCYEIYLNGDRVGEQVLDPGRTVYNETVLYATHDVTDHLERGTNAIGVALGRARFGEHTPNVWNWHNPPWWGDPQLRFQLEVELVDGTTRTVASDEQWAVTDGPTRLDSLFGGEVYDAHRERDGWTSPGYDDSDWDTPRLAEAPGGALVSQLMQPNEVTETLESVEWTEPEPGVYVFDVGQTIAGWVELTVERPAGANVKLTTGEKLTNGRLVDNSNGSVPLPMQVDRYVLESTSTVSSSISRRPRTVSRTPVGTPSDQLRSQLMVTALGSP